MCIVAHASVTRLHCIIILYNMKHVLHIPCCMLILLCGCEVQFVYALCGLFEWLCANENMQVQFVYALYGLFEVVVCK